MHIGMAPNHKMWDNANGWKMKILGASMRGLEDLWRDETGSVTIEFVTLLPFFMALFLLFVDASMLYMTYSDMLLTASRLSRQMSVGTIETEGAAKDFVAEHLSLGKGTYTLNADFQTDTVTIATPIAQAALSGWWMRSVIGSTLFATSTTKREPLM